MYMIVYVDIYIFMPHLCVFYRCMCIYMYMYTIVYTYYVMSYHMHHLSIVLRMRGVLCKAIMWTLKQYRN